MLEMLIAVDTSVRHIAYTAPGPEDMPNNGLRVSYKYGVGVFATRYNAATREYQDTELSESSLKVLKNIVPWLWRPGMPLRYGAWIDLDPAAGGGRPLGRRLEVRLTVFTDEEIAAARERWPDHNSPPVDVEFHLTRMNTAEEWVSLDGEVLHIGYMHELWDIIVQKITAARDAQDKASATQDKASSTRSDSLIRALDRQM